MTENSPWDFQGESSPLTTNGAITTLVDGRSLCISSSNGDINGAAGPQGYFYLDSRLLSRYELFINGRRIEALGKSQDVSFAADFVGRYIDNRQIADFPLTVIRKRSLGGTVVDSIEIRNFDIEAHECEISLIVDADFAHLFAVKEGRASGENASTASVADEMLRFEPNSDRDLAMVVDAAPKPEILEPHRMAWTTTIEPGESFQLSTTCFPVVGGEVILTQPHDSENAPETRHQQWFEKVPRVSSDNMLICKATGQSLVDLESLRIFSPTEPGRPVVAAGAPWFMTLFGRDSLLTSWMSMIVDPDLAAGVLQTLAKFQGKEVNPDKEEEPGKIMHEVRFTAAKSLALEEGDFYYGTADATPLFVMTLGELDRWGEAPDVVDKLIPAADAAIDWLINYGDADGDGYIEYDRSFANSLFNQGWKDSGDGIRFEDGSIPETPMALCEIQAYTYAAYRARARLARQRGDHAKSNDLENRARVLRENFNRDFWIEDKGWFAVGLDHEKKPIDSLTSNLGHCLWTGIVDTDKAPQVVRHLMSSEMFSGWGIRTMSSGTTGYNPTGYHTGSVWPHDTVICAAGMMRYGFVEESHKVMMGLLELAQHSNWRLPELMGGFDRDEFAEPIPYPASCSPQAWSAASTLMILRWILRMDPWCPEGRVWLDPVLPEGMDRLRVENIRVAGHRVTVHVHGDEVDVIGLPEGVDWKRGLRTMEPRERWAGDSGDSNDATREQAQQAQAQ